MKWDAVTRLVIGILEFCDHAPIELKLLMLAKAGVTQQNLRLPTSLLKVYNTTSQCLEITNFSIAPPPFCIANEQFAVMHRDVASERSSPLIIKSTPALAALISAFDVLWLMVNSTSSVDKPPQHLAAVLDQLASGVTDLTAQRALNVSPRTFNRRSAEVIKILNAKSRFQAGAEAARREWI
jgi:hypothetical protein